MTANILTASTAELLSVRTSSDVVTASAATRQISGPICEYGVIGYTSWGPTIFETASLEVPDPVSKVKMLVQHNDYSPAVGVMATYQPDPKKPTATFTIPEGDDGDDALTKAANGLRDGLSVGVRVIAHYFDADNVVHIVKAALYEVSLVTIPAFENAGVTSVAAAHQKGNSSMTREQLAAALAAGQITPEEHDRQIALLDAARPTPPAPVAPAEPVVEAASAPAQTPEPQAPNPSPIYANQRPMDLTMVATRVVEHLQAHGTEGLTAALSDTIPSADAGKAFLGNKKWLDEVWQVGTVRRPLIDTFGAGTLSADGLEGWAWDSAKVPTMPSYAGDAGDVHSEELAWIAKNVAPSRFAGAWGIDRKFVDLGRIALVAKAIAKAVEDYKRQTEAYVRTTALAGATNNATAKADVLTLLNDLGVLALGGSTGATAFNLDFVHLAPALYSEFINLAEADIPWWLKAQGEVNLGQQSGTAGGISFVSNPGLATRQWFAGDSNAVTYEEFDPPVQIEAQNVAKGKIELGAFGYAACLVNDARGLQKGTVTAPA